MLKGTHAHTHSFGHLKIINQDSANVSDVLELLV